MTRLLSGALGLMGCLTLLAGCGSRDPYRRDDVWYPTGANAANLAAMVAKPNDLAAGHGDQRQPASTHVMAAERIQLDQPKKLLSSGGGGGSGSGAAPSATGGGAGGN